MRIRIWIIALLSFFGSFFASMEASAYPHSGISLLIPLVTKDPESLHGFRVAVWYQPKSLAWGKARIYFDAGFGRWWVNDATQYSSLNIYSIAPILRYYFANNPQFSPFINLSLGLSYLTQTKLDGRNLGMHFSFQDLLGLGVSIGKEQKLSLLLSAMHYSNGSLCGHNAGITIPLVLTGEYSFG